MISSPITTDSHRYPPLGINSRCRLTIMQLEPVEICDRSQISEHPHGILLIVSTVNHCARAPISPKNRTEKRDFDHVCIEIHITESVMVPAKKSFLRLFLN